jgi:hypothetical protein
MIPEVGKYALFVKPGIMQIVGMQQENARSLTITSTTNCDPEVGNA